MHVHQACLCLFIDCPQLAFPKLSYKSQFRGGLETDVKMGSGLKNLFRVAPEMIKEGRREDLTAVLMC